MSRPKVIDTVEDSDYKTTWYSCGCNKQVNKYEKTVDWQINPKDNESGRCKYHKEAIL